MNKEAFDFLRNLIKVNSGISLDESKRYLIEERLKPILKKYSLTTINNLVNELKQINNEMLVNHIIEAASTQETYFYRDEDIFAHLKETVIPQLIENNRRKHKIHIWCAGCSTGQEVYTMAFIMHELHAKIPGWDIKILGTDINTQALNVARKGSYSKFEVNRGLPEKIKSQFFLQNGQEFEMRPIIRKNITFRKFNLLDNAKSLGTFDLILCRNVLFYFDNETKIAVLKNMHAVLEDNGYICLGASEKLSGEAQNYYDKKTDDKSVYKVNKTAA